MSGYMCGRNAKQEHEGRWYCGTHYPPTVEAKRAARQAAWQKEYDERNAAHKAQRLQQAEHARRSECFDDLLAALQLLVRHIGVTEFAQDAEPYNTVRAAINKATGEQS
jgi:hypothetical protein